MLIGSTGGNSDIPGVQITIQLTVGSGGESNYGYYKDSSIGAISPNNIDGKVINTLGTYSLSSFYVELETPYFKEESSAHITVNDIRYMAIVENSTIIRIGNQVAYDYIVSQLGNTIPILIEYPIS